MESDEARHCIRNVSRNLLKEARQKRLPLHHFGLTAFAGESDKEILLDIESMIWELLLTREAVQQWIFSGQELNIESFLHHIARNHWIDQTRSRSGDVRRYFRKQIPAYLGSDERFFFRKTFSGAFLALEKNARTAMGLQPDDLEEIAFPYDDFPNTSLDVLNTQKRICRLAVFFLKAVSAMWREPVYVCMDDFIDWLWLIIGDEAEATSLSADHLPFPDEEGEDAPDPFDLEPSRLNQWSDAFILTLKLKQKIAFYQYYCRQRILEDIARQMGLAGPSGVSAHLRNAETLLRSLVTERLGLTREDVTPSAWEFFLKKICRKLKKDVSNPSK